MTAPGWTAYYTDLDMLDMRWAVEWPSGWRECQTLGWHLWDATGDPMTQRCVRCNAHPGDD